MSKHSGIAQYYDLPILSLRNVFLHDALANVSVIRELFHQKSEVPADDLNDVDLRHVSERGCTTLRLSNSTACLWQVVGPPTDPCSVANTNPALSRGTSTAGTTG
jgi:hypothetical protein